MNTPNYHALLKKPNENEILTDNFIVSIGERSYSIIYDFTKKDGTTKPKKSVGGFDSKILPVFDSIFNSGEPLISGDVVTTDGKNKTTLIAYGFNHFTPNQTFSQGEGKNEKVGNIFTDSDFEDYLYSCVPKIETNIQYEGGSSVFPKYIWNKETKEKLPVRGLGKIDNELKVFTNDDFKKDFNKKEDVLTICADAIVFEPDSYEFVWEIPFTDSLGKNLFIGDIISVFGNNKVFFGEIKLSPILGFVVDSFHLKTLLEDDKNQVIRAGSVFAKNTFNVENSL